MIENIAGLATELKLSKISNLNILEERESNNVERITAKIVVTRCIEKRLPLK